jgi:hypothetical protein
MLDEAMVHRPVGASADMANSLRLRRVSAEPKKEFHILPFEVGAHAGIDGGFTIVDFPDPRYPDVVYVEHATWNQYLEDGKTFERSGMAFDQIGLALAPKWVDFVVGWGARVGNGVAESRHGGCRDARARPSLDRWCTTNGRWRLDHSPANQDVLRGLAGEVSTQNHVGRLGQGRTHPARHRARAAEGQKPTSEANSAATDRLSVLGGGLISARRQS